MNILRRAVTPPSKRSAVVGPVQTYAYRGIGQPQYADWGAESAIKQAYLVNTVVYACTRVLAETVASLPFRAGKDINKPTQFRPDAPLARLLGPPPGGPNPDTSASSLMANYVGQRVVTGRYGAEIEWSGKPGKSQVVALWPLVAQYLNPVPASKGTYYFERFEYLINSQPKSLSREQCYYDWQPSLADWRQAESPLQAARLDVSVAVMQDIYDKAFLQNDAKPAHMVVHKYFAKDQERDNWREQFSARFQGPENAGQTLFAEIEDGDVKSAIDVITLGMSQTDADFFRRYEQKIRSICWAMGVPLSKLDASGRTFANAAQEDKAWWQSTILPLLTKLQESINMRLAPLVGNEVGWFDLSAVEALQPVRKSAPADPLKAYQLGIANKNEVRAIAFALDATDGGDEFYVPPAIPAPAAPVAAIAPAPDPKALPVADAPAEPVVDAGRSATKNEPVEGQRAFSPPTRVSRAPEVCSPEGATSTAPALLPARTDASERGTSGRLQPSSRKSSGVSVAVRAAGESPSVGEDDSVAETPPAALPIDQALQREKMWRSIDKQMESLESIWERRFRSLFREQEKATIDRLEGKRGRQALRAVTDSPDNGKFDASSVFHVEGWESATADAAQVLYETVVASSASRMIDKFDVAFSIEAQYVQEFILARANKLAGQVTDTTYRAIQDQLLQGLVEGEGIDKLAKRIRTVFSDASKARAMMIARTEVVSATNASTHLVGMSYPDDVVGGFEWIAQVDHRTRLHHREADGQIVPKGHSFKVGEFTMRFPGDPSAPASEIIACRCTLSAVTPDDMPRSASSKQYRSVDEVTRELIAIATGVAA